MSLRLVKTPEWQRVHDGVATDAQWPQQSALFQSDRCAASWRVTHVLEAAICYRELVASDALIVAPRA